MLSEARKRANRKWNSENSYVKTIRFYNARFPKEMFEKAKEEIAKMGMSQNEFFEQKLKELVGDDRNEH